jgi:ribonuclease D
VLSYTTLDTDAQVRSQIARWHEGNIRSIAVDFEGEFNLHIYGEHLCLIQIFDGFHFYLVDPFAVSPEVLTELLEDEHLKKVMFDCASDAALVRKQYGITLHPVYDVRLSAKLLDITGNLTRVIEQVLNIPAPTGKKGNQTANWLRRPLSSKLIAYALADVEHLLELREALDVKLAAAGLQKENQVIQKQAAVPKRPDRPGWEKLPGYKYLSSDEKVYVRWFFEGRDMLAKKLNKPAFQVLDKRILVSLAKNVPRDEKTFLRAISHRDRHIEQQLLALLTVARDAAAQEIAAKH